MFLLTMLFQGGCGFGRTRFHFALLLFLSLRLAAGEVLNPNVRVKTLASRVSYKTKNTANYGIRLPLEPDVLALDFHRLRPKHGQERRFTPNRQSAFRAMVDCKLNRPVRV